MSVARKWHARREEFESRPFSPASSGGEGGRRPDEGVVLHRARRELIVDATGASRRFPLAIFKIGLALIQRLLENLRDNKNRRTKGKASGRRSRSVWLSFQLFASRGWGAGPGGSAGTGGDRMKPRTEARHPTSVFSQNIPITNPPKLFIRRDRHIRRVQKHE